MTPSPDPVIFQFSPQVTRWMRMLWTAPARNQTLLRLLPTLLTQACLVAQRQQHRVIDQVHIDQALAHLAAGATDPKPRPPGPQHRR
jgi:hypothetical protein